LQGRWLTLALVIVTWCVLAAIAVLAYDVLRGI
jgi:hypothetical protein